MKQYRCTFTNEFHKVGQRITEFEYNNLPYYLKDDYKEVDNETIQKHKKAVKSRG